MPHCNINQSFNERYVRDKCAISQCDETGDEQNRFERGATMRAMQMAYSSGIGIQKYTLQALAGYIA
jgi:hypothetical protein